jgi:SAM-dependent methyltransferase
LRRHGCTAAGVDWPSEQSQRARFVDLLYLVGDEQDFSLIDYGCGHGALADYLHERGTRCRVLGFDLSPEMTAAAAARHGACGCGFAADRRLIAPADYALASGVLNVRLDVPVERWTAYVLDTIDDLAALGRRGFAFNALSSHVPPERRRAHLYYADPFDLLARCAARYSPRVALLHDRWDYEFTMIVRRTDG